MKWNPFLNAAGAAAYIWAVVMLINHISRLHHDTPDNAVGSAAAISLVTLSAAVMAFLFFYRPITLILEHKRKEAVTFFFITIITFGVLTAIPVLTLI